MITKQQRELIREIRNLLYKMETTVEEADLETIAKVPTGAGQESALDLPWQALWYYREKWGPRTGSDVREAMKEGIELARILGEIVVFEFNGQTITIKPGSRFEEIYPQWSWSGR